MVSTIEKYVYVRFTDEEVAIIEKALDIIWHVENVMLDECMSEIIIEGSGARLSDETIGCTAETLKTIYMNTP